MKTFYFLLAIYFFQSTRVYSQTRIVDSLKRELKKTHSDTFRADLLNQTSFQLRNLSVQEAIGYASKANELSKKINYKNGLAESYGYLGLLYYRQGKQDAAVEAHLKSLRIYEELGNKQFIAFRYNDLGNVYVEQEFYDKARAYFNSSLIIKDEIGDEDGVVTTMKNIANLYLRQKNYVKALEVSLRTLPKAEKVGNQRTKADLLSFIAESYLHQDSLDKAEEYYAKVAELRFKSGDQYLLPRFYNGIGRVNYKQKKYAEALENYKLAIEAAKKNNIKVALRKTYGYVAEWYENEKEYEKALYYEKMSNNYKDSLYNQKSNDRIAVLQSIFDDEKAQQERAKEDILQKAKIKQREIVIMASVLVMLLLGLLTLLLWRSNKEKTKKNKLITLQKQEIELQNRNIKASILYAQRIQQAILPSEADLLKYFKEICLLYSPRDIVSGDFFWLQLIHNPKSPLYGQAIIAVGDCTGHGVPGGFMSMIGNDLLDKIVLEREVYEPNLILQLLNVSLNQVLNKQQTDNMDGMEMGICRIDFRQKKIVYAGSMLSLYVCEEGKLKEYCGDKYYLGGMYIYENLQPQFYNQEIEICSPHTFIYMSTDGIQDQFGGEKYRKFSSKRLRTLLESLHEKNLPEQEKCIQEALQSWQGKYAQTDDILLLGFKI